ncbi:uncharacterized protein LOC110255146 [Exaiptasia diaphana]|uniref:Uncharacterized protein n=1 Tax=Exaiptasia diaphana TaxID=2652724 RepID=A0A913YBJ4_EXADI|nr:uncharacterized protein LOC110255146 [Exaiptasia diaphana]KXJ19232.1 hypothetical protein AC249_AIPGENE17166 [Exaiptasia diaphana]
MKIFILLIICATLALAVSSFDQETVAQITHNSDDKTIADRTGKNPLLLESPRRRPIRCRQYRKQSIKKSLENQNLRKLGIRLIKVSGKQLRILKARKTIVRPIRRRYSPWHRRKRRRQSALCKEDPVNTIKLASAGLGLAYSFNSVTCGTNQNCKVIFRKGGSPIDIGKCQPNKKEIDVKVFRRLRGSRCRRFVRETINIACACQCIRFPV